jgi:phage terminase large subunit
MIIQIPEKLKPLFRPKRYKVFFGGRGGAKTVSFSKALLFFAHQKSMRIVGIREFMSSIKESVHSSLSEEVATLNMSNHFDVLDTQIRGRNGSQFFYMGISRNPSAVRSLHDVDILWNEEAEYTSERSLKIIIPTIIRKEMAELWFSLNPEDEFGAVYSRFIKPHLAEINSRGFYEDDELYVGKINLSDNPFASEGILKDSAEMKKTNYKEWLHVYGGECFSDYRESIIQPEWFDAAIDAHKKLGFQPLGDKVCGFDLADTGDDKALVMRHGPVIEKAKRWSYGELPEAIDIAFEKADEWLFQEMVYDDDGMGRSMKVYLANVSTDKSLTVTPYNGSSSVDNPDEIYNPNDPKRLQKKNKEYFYNKRAQKYWDLRDRFEAVYNAVTKGVYTDPDKMISIASDIDDIDVLKGELVKIKRVKGNTSKIQIQSKKDAIKEGIRSPNMADALKMSFANDPEKLVIVSNLSFDSEF